MWGGVHKENTKENVVVHDALCPVFVFSKKRAGIECYTFDVVSVIIFEWSQPTHREMLGNFRYNKSGVPQQNCFVAATNQDLLSQIWWQLPNFFSPSVGQCSPYSVTVYFLFQKWNIVVLRCCIETLCITPKCFRFNKKHLASLICIYLIFFPERCISK